MWNVNVRKSAIWTVKSINEYDEYYKGMSCGTSQVLIVSSYLDADGVRKFTYLKVFDTPLANWYYMKVKLKDKIKYVRIDELQTGDQRCLETYLGYINFNDFINIVNVAKEKSTYINKKYEEQPKVETKQQKIHKFGIDVYVTENDYVHISEKGKLILSKEAKEDIIYNSSTDEEVRDLCSKYQIYPVKAIKEIRNRLVYQHKQKEG